MKFKGIMLIFLLAILTIGVVSASDNLATDVANVVSDESVDLSVVDGADESIGDSVAPGYDFDVLSSDFKYDDNKFAQNHHNFSVIKEKIDPYVRNQTIELSGYYESDGSSISIQSIYGYQSTLTINGNGATLDGKGISGMISSSETNVVLNDIIFVNVYDDFNGSQRAVLGNNLTINNCTFVNCTPGKSGGGGGAISCYGYLIVNDCSFVNCSGTGWGAAIAFGSDSDEGICFISDCSFVNCSSEQGGAIRFYSDYGEKDLNCSIFNCSFVDCSSKDSGGAISSSAYYSLSSNVNVLKCSFVNCFSGNTTTALGGAIFLSNGNFSVSDCTFRNCRASGDGGAIVLFESNSSVSDCSFVNCSACLPNYSLDDAQGGAIYLGWSNSSVSDCSFVDCYATYAGGAISLKDGSYSVSNSSFLSCSASEYGGGIYFNSKNSKLLDSYFKGNVAKNGSDWYSEYYEINNTITKISTDLEASNVIATYGGSKNLVITLKDGNNNLLSNMPVKIVLNGKTYYRNTTSEGKVVFAVPTNLAPNSYDAELSFAGDGKYIASSKIATVEVKKATPKITAKAKTFKKSVKTKKYTIKLNVKQKVKVAVKVNKKTYYAYTNTKGQATFKITKLTKNGKYTATVSSTANKYYNKAKSVNVKITVK